MVYTKMQYTCGALIPKVGGVIKNGRFALTKSAADVLLKCLFFFYYFFKGELEKKHHRQHFNTHIPSTVERYKH